MKLSKDDDTFLVIRTNRAEIGRIRRTIHREDFGYTGDDAVLTPGQNKDYMGLPVRMMTDMLETYWDDWKALTKKNRKEKEND